MIRGAPRLQPLHLACEVYLFQCSICAPPLTVNFKSFVYVDGKSHYVQVFMFEMFHLFISIILKSALSLTLIGLQSLLIDSSLTVSNDLLCLCVWLCVRVFFTGTLNVLLRVRSIASVDSVVWTKSGDQGPNWRKAFFDISPSGPFQVMTW